MTSLLRIDASARYDDSVGRQLADSLIQRITAAQPAHVVSRDLGKGVSLLDEATVNAVFTPAEQRNDEQLSYLAEGHQLIEELNAADLLVIAMPIYNFGPPASLKAWADLVARAGQTFRYSEAGPEGLLADRPVYLIVTSGGVPLESPMDFATGWIRTFLGFLGLKNVTIIEATGLNTDPESALAAARQAVVSAPLPAVG